MSDDDSKPRPTRRSLLAAGSLVAITGLGATGAYRMAVARTTVADPVYPVWRVAGVYPQLAMYNSELECGVGAVVPWSGALWTLTYAPHAAAGSDDGLYQINARPALNRIQHTDTVGGTPAGRMIHEESQQLFLGAYAIDRTGGVRTIDPEKMTGRITGIARHLKDPANKIYIGTMEEGLYEIDVHTLSVLPLYVDNQWQVRGETPPSGTKVSALPGYHGKGLYSGQGVLVYANNGDPAKVARLDPWAQSGCLAEWDGVSWRVLERAQFCEVTGPGGINGSDIDSPIWATGWDARSVILAMRDQGVWHRYRLPKATRTYDGAHGWNTEWPRIRDVGSPDKPDLLMTMHGMFWRFPKGFRAGDTSGVRARSSYLKVVTDFAAWEGSVVAGCNDTPSAQFLSTRSMKGSVAHPERSHSNLWFLAADAFDGFGPANADGALFLNEPTEAGRASDPILFAGWGEQSAVFANHSDHRVALDLEADISGASAWLPLQTIIMEPHSAQWIAFDAEDSCEWLRIVPRQTAAAITANFVFIDSRGRRAGPDPIFNGLARIEATKAPAKALIRSDDGHLELVVVDGESPGRPAGYYRLSAEGVLSASDRAGRGQWMVDRVAIPLRATVVDKASVVITDETGRRWRLPKGDAGYDAALVDGSSRLIRETITERDLLNCHGTFYEAPADNAGGFAGLRPIASHDFKIVDFCSHRGMLVMTGVAADGHGARIVRSEDQHAAVWVGVIDDLWRMGKPVGRGGPWRQTDIRAGEPSDPYLLWGYDKRELTLRHDLGRTVVFTIELDSTGGGHWFTYRSIEVAAGQRSGFIFPAHVQARWLRVNANADCSATATLYYS